VEININSSNGELLVELSGRLDASSSPLIQKTFDEMSEDLYRSNVVLDFSAVNYVSSAGLRVLFILQKKILAAQGSLNIRNLNDVVREVFHMTGFYAIFKII
jgi:anti-anti-sigma factor